MKRVTNKYSYGSLEEIDCDSLARLILIRFIHEVFEIVCLEENKWEYTYEDKALVEMVHELTLLSL